MLHFKRRTEFAHFTPQQTDEAGDVVSDCNYPVEESQKPTSLPHIYGPQAGIAAICAAASTERRVVREPHKRTPTERFRWCIQTEANKT